MEREAYRALVQGAGWGLVADDGPNVLARHQLETEAVYALALVGAQAVRRVEVVVLRLYPLHKGTNHDGYNEGEQPFSELLVPCELLPIPSRGWFTPTEASRLLMSIQEGIYLNERIVRDTLDGTPDLSGGQA